MSFESQRSKARVPHKSGRLKTVRQTVKGKNTSRKTGRKTDALIYGTHAVLAALNNPMRHNKVLFATSEAAAKHGLNIPLGHIKSQILERGALSDMLHPGAVHQGLVLEAAPLPALPVRDLDDKSGAQPIVLLDQVTDPQNIGAILRSCAAFGAGALVVQDRHSPEITGALAKAACGAVETVPICRVVNMSRTVHALREAGRICLALDTGGDELGEVLHQVSGERLAVLLGAEGQGLRRLPKEGCDRIARLDMAPEMPSLNVSNVAAIVLYAMAQGRQQT